MPDKPYFYFAFANNNKVPEDYLKELKKERKELSRIMRKPDDWVLQVEADASLSMLTDFFRNHEDQVAIFHYSGHAGKDRIVLEDNDENPEDAFSYGLAGMTRNCRNLKLVFLNGCCTESQIRDFVKAGVPVVIATTKPIEDPVAKDFALNFYAHIAKGKTLKYAFEQALVELLVGRRPVDLYRKRGFDIDEEDLRNPYVFYVNPDYIEVADESVKDWIKDGPDLPKSPLHENVYLLCNRREEEQAVINFLKEKVALKRPNFFLIHGSEAEKPDKLVERLLKYSLKKFLTSLGISGTSIKAPNPIEFPQKPELAMDLESPGHAWEAMLSYYKNELNLGVNRKLGPKEIIRRLGANKDLLLIQHELFSSKWHEDQCQFIKKYIEEFWKYELTPKDPVVIIIFNLTYVDSGGWLKFLQRPEKGIEEELNKLGRGNNAKVDEGPNVWVLPRLKEVQKTDVLSWQRKHLPNQPNLVNKIFKKRTQELPMSELIEPLKSAIESELKSRA